MVAQKSISTVMFDTEQFALTDGDEILIKGVSPKVTATGGATARTLADWMADISEKLTAAEVFYVRVNGDDDNDGKTDTDAGAFATIQRAVDVVKNSVNLNDYNVTISVQAGTYTAGVAVDGPWAGSGKVTIQGNFNDASAHIISVTSGNCVTLTNGAELSINGFTFSTTTSGDCLDVGFGCFLTVAGEVIFGASAGFHIDSAGLVAISGDYEITGDAVGHWHAPGHGRINAESVGTITLTDTPDFTSYFAGVGVGGHIQCDGITFSGSATGKRFLVHHNGILDVGANSVTYLPGDETGEASTGGLYFGSDYLGNSASALAHSAVAASVSATTNEETLATITVPANAMGTKGYVRIWTAWTVTNSANSKTLRVKFGGTAYTTSVLTTVATVSLLAQIHNRGAANSQVGHGAGGLIGLGSATGAHITSAVDTTADVSITLTGEKANSGETLTLESYVVELIR